jgi:hypothetical protein
VSRCPTVISPDLDFVGKPFVSASTSSFEMAGRLSSFILERVSDWHRERGLRAEKFSRCYLYTSSLLPLNLSWNNLSWNILLSLATFYPEVR